jgi:hypothetical protein
MSDTRSAVLELLRRAGTWDADSVGELFADEVTWDVSTVGTLPWTGHRTRREQVPDYFKTIWSYIVPAQTRIVLDILLIEGEDAVQLGTFSHLTRLAARGETLVAFDGRCIPGGGVAPPSNTAGILSRRAWPAGRLARLGATPDFHHGLLERRSV